MQDPIKSTEQAVSQDVSNIIKLHRRYIYVISALVVVISILFFRECSHQAQEDKLVKNIAQYSDSAKFYKSKVGTVTYNKSLNFNNDAQLKSYLTAHNDTLRQLLKNFKTIGGVTVIKEQVFVHDTVSIKYETKIPCVFTPFDVVRDCTYYHFRGTIFQDKFKIDTLRIDNKQSIVVGVKRINLFKTEERVEVLNSNPLLNISKVGEYTITHKPKRFGIGASVGYGFNSYNSTIRLSPYIGISINYSIINF